MVARTVLAAVLVALGGAAAVPGAVAAVGPDGRIAFQSRADGDDDIYVMDADGSNVLNLTDGPGGPDDRMPDWSPDGTRIAYTSWAGEEDAGGDIWVMDADGGAKRQLTDNAGALSTYGPRWSPDGTRIAYTHDPGGSHDLDVFTMAADGSDKVDVTSPWETLDYADYEPNWSPDGGKLIFSGVRAGEDGGAYEIVVANPDGSGQEGIGGALDHSGEVRWASFRPDGQKIVYARCDFFTSDWDVWVMNPDGSGKENVTRSDSFDADPAWSPDGTQILFSSDRSGGLELELFTLPYPPAGVAALFAELAATAPVATPLGRGGEAADWTGPASATADVTVGPAGFTPDRIAAALGQTLVFRAEGEGHALVHAAPLRLFSSGTMDDGGTFSYRFVAAATYAVLDRGTRDKAKVSVLPALSAAGGAVGAPVSLQWAAVRAAAGQGYDVQVDPPGTVDWQPFRDGAARRAGAYTPDGAGTYRFRARLRDLASGAATAWSPVARYAAG